MFAVKKLTTFIIRSFIGPFFTAFFITLFIFIMQFVFKYIDDLMGKGLEISVILQLIGYASIALVLPFSLPLSVLFASILTLGNLGERNELTAMKVAGLSARQILSPLFYFILLIAAATLWLSTELMPRAMFNFRQVYSSILNSKPAFNIEEKMFYRELEGLVLRIGKKDPDDPNIIYDIVIYDATQNNSETNQRVTTAEKGLMQVIEAKNGKKKLYIQLMNGRVYEENYSNYDSYKTHPNKRYTFEKMEKFFNLPNFSMTDSNNVYKSLDTKSLGKLNEEIQQQKNELTENSLKTQKMLEQELFLLQDDYLKNCYAYESAFIQDQDKTDDPAIILDAEENQQKVKQKIEKVINEIKYYVDRKEMSLRYVDEVKIEWHNRITLPIVCIVMFFIGAPLGTITKKGGVGFPLILSVVFFILHYMTNTFTKQAAEDGEILPFLSYWTGIFLLTPISLYFGYMAKKEANLKDIIPFKKIWERLKKMTKK